jgi:hypothetical protein
VWIRRQTGVITQFVTEIAEMFFLEPALDQFTWEAVNRRVSQQERERRNWCDDF